MTVFFTSDTHFGHNNIISYCGRPYANVEEMNEAMVKAWNQKVTPQDTVYHLGDVAFHNFEVIPRLNGKIRLVPGNHDLERSKKVMHLFDAVLPELSYLKLGPDLRFVLCHYPIYSWRREYLYHLHGHMHGQGPWQFNRMDVGVDAQTVKTYAPLSVEEVVREIEVINEKYRERCHEDI